MSADDVVRDVLVASLYDTLSLGCFGLVVPWMGHCWAEAELSPMFSVALNDEVSGCCLAAC